MWTSNIGVPSAEGGCFDCYLAAPDSGAAVPAVVLASAIHGVDDDLRGIAEDFASRGCIAAAPDLFWRTTPGPLARGDPRCTARAQPRLAKIRTGEQDLVDVLQELRRHRSFDGRAVVIGFCYGGPYAILGPRRLGYDAGMACHGSQLLDYLPAVGNIRLPMRFVWGDQDHLAPEHVREAYRAVAARLENVAVHVLPGVRHGYMMRSNAMAFDRRACDFTVECAMSLVRSVGTKVGGGVTPLTSGLTSSTDPNRRTGR